MPADVSGNHHSPRHFFASIVSALSGLRTRSALAKLKRSFRSHRAALFYQRRALTIEGAVARGATRIHVTCGLRQTGLPERTVGVLAPSIGHIGCQLCFCQPYAQGIS